MILQMYMITIHACGLLTKQQPDIHFAMHHMQLTVTYCTISGNAVIKYHYEE